MLQIGLSFENAMGDMSQYERGLLYDVMSQWSRFISKNFQIFTGVKWLVLFKHIHGSCILE